MADPFAGVDGPRPGMVKLAAETGAALTMILTGSPDRGGGVGGWQESERVLRPNSAWWKSRPLSTISLPCMIDIDAIGGPSVERRLEVLYTMGESHNDDDPPAIRLFGDVPTATTQNWKLDNITLGDRLFQPDNPEELRRQELTIELSELFIADGVSQATVKSTRPAGSSARRRRTIASKQGDTLRSIAVRQLGSSGEYTKIRSWNPKLAKTDPDAPLRVGTQVVLN